MEARVVNKEFIFTEPYPTPSCHASTLALHGQNLLHAAWFGGSREGQGDVGIWYARRDGKGWCEPRPLAGQVGVPHWNPVLFAPPGGKLRLFYKRGTPISRWQTWWMETADSGRTWSIPVPLIPGDYGGRGPVKNKPVVLRSGTWLAGASLEQGCWSAFTDRSDDGGYTWVSSEMIYIHKDQRRSRAGYLREGMPVGEDWDHRGVIQPTLWESSPGMVHMLLRSSEGRVYRSDSTNNGLSWCTAYPTSLPNNNSGFDLARLEDGRLVLALNPVEKNWGERTPLVLVISDDNGETWMEGPVLEDSPGEYSYPSVIASGRTLYVSYTWNRERIAVCEVQASHCP
jgi:predicted neuraminidase